MRRTIVTIGSVAVAAGLLTAGTGFGVAAPTPNLSVAVTSWQLRCHRQVREPDRGQLRR